MDRPVQIIKGCEWEPTTDSFDISPKVSHLYEKTRQKVFAILETEADEENRQHPELYGKGVSIAGFGQEIFRNKNAQNAVMSY
ncbi:hypothetical protein EMIT07CA2_50349 [Brevibacillus sp. IT-7CA2]|uniref:hypothetical protein n=1 Tax=Brevibacillus sp. IT-7CA2 TaxID=3026436 RepID=UPI0039E154B6